MGGTGASASAVRKLILERPGSEPQEFAVTAGPLRAGRLRSNEVMIAGDKATSREHCRFDYDPARHVLTVSDLGSSNGTFVNGERVGAQPVKLKPGDRIQVGNVFLGYAVEPVAASPGKAGTPASRPPNRPWPVRPGDAGRTVFGPGYCICGRCGVRFAIPTGPGLRPGDKVGCAHCRAVWRAPPREKGAAPEPETTEALDVAPPPAGPGTRKPTPK